MENKIEWTDIYKTKLAIYHHLAEVKRKFEFYVDIEDKEYSTYGYLTTRDSFKYRAWECAEKEMTDLYLLIESYLCQSNRIDLVNKRIERFNQKKVSDG